MPMDVVAMVVGGSGSAVMPMDVVAVVVSGSGSGYGSGYGDGSSSGSSGHLMVVVAVVVVAVGTYRCSGAVVVTVEMLDYDWCVAVNKMQGDAGVAWTSQLKLEALNDGGEVGIEHHLSTIGLGDAWDDEVGVDGMIREIVWIFLSMML
ncbi:hypothetical protein BU17DRAFT_71826 [Hysterangium stoloniferum]|nr:hypothetical protein BU17DRAFT_71826 [Hysterangium stoloniferum]